MYTPAQLTHTRTEIRRLRIENAGLKRWHLSQKQRADRLEKENTELKKEITRLKRQEQELQEKLKDTEQQRDSYKGMVFKARKKLGSAHTTEEKRERGGQRGHIGHGRKKPERIDRIVHAFLTHCPDCQTPIDHARAVKTHTIVDLPHWQEMRPITTTYRIERQWCRTCNKEVGAVPRGVIPGSRVGIVVIVMVMMWKYRLRLPLAKIVELLDDQYGLGVSAGTLQGFLEKAKTSLGTQYDALKAEIRGSPVKHADETGWRVGGENWWCWLFATDRVRVYTIEETRGKGVPQRELKKARGVLVHDDYGGYQKLPMIHQSCWTHLLRKSHEATIQDGASDEVKTLHQKLKELFELLCDDVSQPFDRAQRQEWHEWYAHDIEKLSQTEGIARDAKKIHARLKHQGTNLITALLYPNVPLTNNVAERGIRPMVITRKISGGSKTSHGANIHAVNMSIVETIGLQKQPLLDTLHAALLGGAGEN